MAIIKPFKSIRPNTDVVSKVAALPYDVYNRTEALEVISKNDLSFLRIDRAETNFDSSVSTYDPKVYVKAKELINEFIDKKIYIQDEEEYYYVYELIMNGRSQTGLVVVSSIDDYINDIVKKHEKTREDKAIDRINHVDITNKQTGPIFLTYRKNDEVKRIIDKVKESKSIYSFISDDNITHNVWIISNKEDINNITNIFSNIPYTYIADGHHRCNSAVTVGLKRRKENPNYTGKEPFNYFLSVLFQDEELMIMPYNRCVKDLNNLTKEEFFSKIKMNFDITLIGNKQVQPESKGTIGMYLDNEWYQLKIKHHLKEITDPVLSLDVSLLQNYLLDPVLGIKDPRTDNRIDFIGGIRGLNELEKRAKTDMKIAFSMYPTSIKELLDVADNNLLMPPKSTWFEPKLRSGIFLHDLEK